MMYPYSESLLDPKNGASKRVSRACDRCRLKKTKCDGRRCCNRCLADDAICVFSKRKRSSDRPYSSEYVQLLEDQQMKLVEGVQELYRKLRRGEGWTGPKIAEDSQGYPLVQDVLDSLAILAPCERRGSKRKADVAEIDDEDEDDDMPTHIDRRIRIESASPPLTPTGCSQSSITSSPIDRSPIDGLSMTYGPAEYLQIPSKPSLREQNLCPTYRMLPNQPLLADSASFWSMATSYNGPGGALEYPGLIEPLVDAQVGSHWYQGAYLMM